MSKLFWKYVSAFALSFRVLLLGKRMATTTRATWRVLPLLFLIAVFGLASVAEAQLAHRYSFTSDASDSIGGANGVIVDAGTATNYTFTGGQLDFSANTGQSSNGITEDAYVDLPNGIVSAAVSGGTDGAVAFEFWATVTETHTWQRFGDFGNSNGGEDTSPGGGSANYVLITPNSGRYTDGLEITNHTSTGQEPSVGLQGPFAVGTEHHVVAVYNHNNPRSMTTAGSNGTMSLYLDGNLVGHGPIHPDINLRSGSLNDVNNWLGRSQWPDPVFDGSFNEFRIYNQAPSDEYVFNSYLEGPDSVPTFDPWELEFDFSFEVNRDDGSFTLANDGPPVNLVACHITSPSGALDPAHWLSITDNSDSDSGGSFDPDDYWEIETSTNAELSEETLGDGGQLGTGGTQTSLALGDAGAWIRYFTEDVTVTVEILDENYILQEVEVPVDFVGGINDAPYTRSDLNFDGAINATDWETFRDNHLTDLSAMTVVEAYRSGDLNGDLANDFTDFRLFQQDYDAANGAGAFAAMVAGVPEPSGIGLMLAGSFAYLLARRRITRKPY
ncbi:MAG: PEP-CTERM sorting domain-containing protein [Pirellulales bacterium]|nr:PEP-CTERM sorting domain-containing protein [Pirellulales bacterium]